MILHPRFHEFFDIREFVPPHIYSRYGRRSYQFMDVRVLNLITEIRIFFGKPIIVNTWHRGGDLSKRGFRLPSEKVGSIYSQHKFGRAIDFTVAGMTPDEVRAVILANEDLFMSWGLTTIERGEDAPTWVHIDIRYTGMSKIWVVAA